MRTTAYVCDLCRARICDGGPHHVTFDPLTPYERRLEVCELCFARFDALARDLRAGRGGDAREKRGLDM